MTTNTGTKVGSYFVYSKEFAQDVVVYQQFCEDQIKKLIKAYNLDPDSIEMHDVEYKDVHPYNPMNEEYWKEMQETTRAKLIYGRVK